MSASSCLHLSVFMYILSAYLHAHVDEMQWSSTSVLHSYLPPKSRLRTPAGTPRYLTSAGERNLVKGTTAMDLVVGDTNQAGKIDNCIQEMERLRMDVVGLSEVRWTNSGMIDKGDHLMVYSGGQKHQNGVGILMTKKMASCLQGYIPVSDRVIVAKFQAKPMSILFIQVYAPTSSHSDDEVESFYDDVDKALKHTRNDDIIIVCGDFNAQVGNEAGSAAGGFGLGKRNDRGSRLVTFCDENDLIITNTVFKQHPRPLYTWKSPGDQSRYQIDYILINNRFRNSVKNVFTYPGADVNSDYVLLVIKMKVRLKSKKQTVSKACLQLDLLRDDTIRGEYNVQVFKKYQLLRNEDVDQSLDSIVAIDKQFENLKESLHHGLEETLPKKRRMMRKEWMTEKILEKMDRRRKVKDEAVKYNEIEREIRSDCRRVVQREM